MSVQSSQSSQSSDAALTAHYNKWIAGAIVFGCGAVIGAALALLSVPSKTAGPLALSAKPVEMVLVVQTATSAAAVPVAQPTVEAVAPQPTQLPIVGISETLKGAPDYARMGDTSAPIQLVVFADPQCPFCRQQALETEPQLIEQYVKTGKASLTYRHFTFLGAESQRIASAMVCAGAQGGNAFWEFKQYAYAHQFSENSGLATDAALALWARAVKLDEGRFKACLAGDAARAQVDADTAAGRALGVTGTPTLFVNGRPMPGALPFDFIKTAIDAELTH